MSRAAEHFFLGRFVVDLRPRSVELECSTVMKALFFFFLPELCTDILHKLDWPATSSQGSVAVKLFVL